MMLVEYPNTAHQERAFQALKQAMVRFFAARSRSTQRDLNELFRVGRYSLAIGAATLIICLLLAQLTTRLSLDPPLGRLIEESF